jgi:DNA transposition AAA+ family ATPase
MRTPPRSSAISTTNVPSDFVITKEHRRFAEFCDACRHYRYIGLCYGAPGVGKTLSARAYANWGQIEASIPVQDASPMALTALLESDTVFYTPAVVHTPAQVEHDIRHLRSTLRPLRVEDLERKQRVQLDAIRTHERAAEEERQRRLFTEFDWYADPPPAGLTKPASPYMRLAQEHHHALAQIADPTTLVIIDEADLLKMMALEQVRAVFDRGGIGVVFIGMPGIEKRLSRYPQLYSRVGFVHAFRPLSAQDVRQLLDQQWLPSGVVLPETSWRDEETLAAMIRITGGNFRLLHRLITQSARLVEINALAQVTHQVVEAARENLVIGTA